MVTLEPTAVMMSKAAEEAIAKVTVQAIAEAMSTAMVMATIQVPLPA